MFIYVYHDLPFTTNEKENILNAIYNSTCDNIRHAQTINVFVHIRLLNKETNIYLTKYLKRVKTKY